jgi:putative endonuclease
LNRWFVYLLECENGRLYTGISTDVEKRFAAHLSGKGAFFTRLNRPKRILGAHPFPDRSSALRAEAALRRRTRPEKLLWAERADAREEPASEDP